MKEHKSSTLRGAAVVAHLQALHAGRDPVIGELLIVP